MDSADLELFGDRVRTRLSQLEVPMTVEPIEFYGRHSTGSIEFRRRTGYVIDQIIKLVLSEDYFCIVGPHEQLFSDHLCSLLRTLQDHEDAGCAWSDMLLKHKADGNQHADLAEKPDIHSYHNNRPIGSAASCFERQLSGGTSTPRSCMLTLSPWIFFMESQTTFPPGAALS